MKIGLDGIVLRTRNAGSLRYFEQVLAALADHGGMHDYHLFCSPDVLALPSIPGRSNFHKHSVTDIPWLPGAVRQQFYYWRRSPKLDLLHSLVFVPPLWYGGKVVMTVFDLTFKLYPHTQKWSGRLWWSLLGRMGVRRADRLITISESTKSQIVNLMGVPTEAITVIYPYVTEHFSPTADCRAVANRYGLPQKYILYVGTLERRKNIVMLLRAFVGAKRRAPLDHILVFVGQPGWLYADIFRAVEELGLETETIFLDYVPDEDLPALYSAADLFAYLSLYEGFGLPVLEAMACGTPVLASNAASLPEVIGEAGRMVEPGDVEGAAEAIVELLEDSGLRARLVQAGRKQARKFSRERSATQLLRLYCETVS